MPKRTRRRVGWAAPKVRMSQDVVARFGCPSTCPWSASTAAAWCWVLPVSTPMAILGIVVSPWRSWRRAHGEQPARPPRTLRSGLATGPHHIPASGVTGGSCHSTDRGRCPTYQHRRPPPSSAALYRAVALAPAANSRIRAIAMPMRTRCDALRSTDASAAVAAQEGTRAFIERLNVLIQRRV
jgi:hypothetical protein